MLVVSFIAVVIFARAAVTANAQTNNQPSAAQLRGLDQLRAIAKAIRKCPDGQNVNPDGSGMAFTAPMNVVWDVDNHKLYQGHAVGYIEYVQRMVYTSRKLEQCRKRDKACRDHNEDIQSVDALLESTNFPDNFRMEFDLSPTGLVLMRVLKKLESQDASHWIATEMGKGCETDAVTSVIGPSE